MERNSPLLQAVRSAYDDTDYVVDEGRDNVKTGDITAVMSYDQMSHLLTLMVTISVISILILIFSVTVILGFLWYTRNLLNRKCGCSKLHEQSTNINVPVYQHHQLMSSAQHPVVHGSGQIVGHVGHVHGGHVRHGVAVQDSHPIYRANKNVTVNPLPPPKLYQTNQFGSPRRNLVPTVNPSQEERCLDNSISSSDYDINHVTSLDQLGHQDKPDEADPIYAEIKARDERKEDSRDCLKSNSELESKQNKSGPVEHQEVGLGKKEIEYWQITAKEVVKFRPCTETFIVRE